MPFGALNEVAPLVARLAARNGLERAGVDVAEQFRRRAGEPIIAVDEAVVRLLGQEGGKGRISHARAP